MNKQKNQDAQWINSLERSFALIESPVGVFKQTGGSFIPDKIDLPFKLIFKNSVNPLYTITVRVDVKKQILDFQVSKENTLVGYDRIKYFSSINDTCFNLVKSVFSLIQKNNILKSV